eukprot:m.10243 g.10243  ORF g.10243 m.10243 type:complete len:200 (+) comp8200_c0_seq1:80-679(+)
MFTSSNMFALGTLGVIIITLGIPSTTADLCPNVTTYRSQYVQESFEPSLLSGLWYEQAYIDIAQILSKCQTMNASYSNTTGIIDIDFKVDYGPIPFTIVEVYTPINSATKGYYIKEARMPGAQFLQLRTAVVDVGHNGMAPYTTMTLYSCVNKLGIKVPELVFATRDRTPNATVLAEMEKTARSLGVQWDDKNLKTSQC